MSNREQSMVQEPAVTLKERRDFLRLGIAERRKRLATQAEEVLRHYTAASAVEERTKWQVGDITEF